MTAPQRWKHVMVDIETMGTDQFAPIMAVGIVPFQLHREQCEVAPVELHREWRLTLKANEHVNRQADGRTVEWWLRQSDAARAALLAEPRLEDARQLAEAIDLYLRDDPQIGIKDLTVWAKPPQFDLEILRHFYSMLNVPWLPSQKLERDSRPLIDIAVTASWPECFPAPTVEHGALSDAVEQAEQVVRIYRRVMGW